MQEGLFVEIREFAKRLKILKVKKFIARMLAIAFLKQ
jgi:hypothetical protein